MSVKDSATAHRVKPLLSPWLRLGRDIRRDASASAVLCGVVAIVIGYAGPAVIVLAAARSGGLSAEQSSSWIWAASMGSGSLGLILSAWTRQPIMISWSTPGAALLVTSLGHYRYSAVIGCYLMVAVATIIVGWRGWFGAIIAKIPTPLVSAMLAGVLFSFGTEAFGALKGRPLIPVAVLLGYLVGSWFSEQAAVPLALLAGVAAAITSGQVHLAGIAWHPTQPVFTTPSLSLAAIIGIGLPLFIVTMTAQNAAGLSILSTHGYQPDDRKLVTAAGLGSLIFAPFGCHAVNLAAIIAAIGAGPSAHADRARRYVAGLTGGVAYLVGGTFAGAIVGLFAGLPASLIAVLAGVALLGALAGALGASMADAAHRHGAVVTLLVTVSGITIGGVGSACWGLLFGLVADRVLALRERRNQTD